MEGRALAAGDAAEVWSRVVAPSTGLDHLDKSTLFVLDEPGDLAEAAEFLWRQAEERHRELVEGGELPKDWPQSYLPSREWKARLHGARTLELTWQSDAQDAAGMAFASRGLTSGDLFGWREPVLPPGRTERLVDGVEHWLGERRRVVLASDQAPRLAELLGEAGHPVGIVSRISEAPPPGAIALIERSLNGGFEGGPDGLAVVTDRELFGSVRVARRPKAMRRVVPRDILERLTPGDMVVHIDHGIARYEQMLRRGEPGEERDYLELSFAAGDRIFVPVEQINRVSRYSGGEHPQLSRLGGTDWLRTKQRVPKAVIDLAEELLDVYAKHRRRRGVPYRRTAVADGVRGRVPVRADAGPARRRRDQGGHGARRRWTGCCAATSGTARPSWRCGRRSRRPRTASRWRCWCRRPCWPSSTTAVRRADGGFPFTVECIAVQRRRSSEETVAGPAAGQVDILIGTHRLISKDVTFKDLGLVVIDEEQRFGVTHKERLKQMRKTVDVLTMSATPIPRTLHMSMLGSARHSSLTTAPQDRRRVVTERRGLRQAAAAKRDPARAAPRGAGLLRAQPRAQHRATAPTDAADGARARIVVGHGQMGEGEIEEVMLKFIRHGRTSSSARRSSSRGSTSPMRTRSSSTTRTGSGCAELHQLRGASGGGSTARTATCCCRRTDR